MPAVHIYLSPAAETALAPRAGANRSAATSRMLERYEEACRRALPDLIDEEWQIIYAATNGWLIDSASSVRYLPMEVEDYLQGCDIHSSDLVAKLQALDYCGLMAVVDAAERYWALVENAA